MSARRIVGIGGVWVGVLAGRAGAELPWPTVSRVPQSSTGVRLTLDPWEDNSYLQSESVMLLEERGHLHGGAEGEAQHVFFSDMWGRGRVLKRQNDDAGWEKTNEFGMPAVGFRWAAIDFGIHRPGLPTQMQDIAAAVGVLLPPGNFGTVSVVGGVGYAGNSPFGDGDAYYGIAHLADSWRLDAESKFVISLDYDGNRGFMPDVPLPGFAYVRTSEKDRYRLWLGFPETSLVWRPTESVVVAMGWMMPESAGVRVTWEVVRGVSLYASADNFFDGFHYSSDTRDRRFFFQQRRAEIGVRIILGKWVDLSLGGGYAWNQNLYHGFDDRSLSDVTRFDDGAFVSLRFGGSF